MLLTLAVFSERSAKRMTPSLGKLSLVATMSVGLILLFNSWLQIQQPWHIRTLNHAFDPQSSQRLQNLVYESEFPRRIWQAFGLTGVGGSSDLRIWANQVQTWKASNPDWEYNLLDSTISKLYVWMHPYADKRADRSYRDVLC